MKHDETRAIYSKQLLDYIKANPHQNAKRIEAGLGWSQNKTLRMLKHNKESLQNGWVLKSTHG